ncbi:MAG TPA: MMPL family transporter [Galbitalea sp.]|jgi:RND superfamily putative drug exporter
MAELLYRLGKWAAKRAGVVVVAWAVLLGLAAASFLLFAGSLSASFDIPGTATQKVSDQLAKKLPDFSGASGSVVYHTTDNKPFTDAQQADIQKVVADANDLQDVATVSDPFAIEDQRARQEAQLKAGLAQLDAAQKQLDAGSQQLDAAIAQSKAAGTYAQAKPQLDAQAAELEKQQAALTAQRQQATAGSAQLALAKNVRTVSADGTTAVVNISFDKTIEELPDSAKTSVKHYFEGHPVNGVDLYFSSTIAQTIPEVIGVGEVVGFIIAGIVLFIMLGTLIAAGLPLLNALVGVGVGVLFCLSFSNVVDEASVTPVLGVMLGLAVGIDYSLFIINRHRKQLMQGIELHESIGLANGTAGNAVVFAGATVVVALLALNVTGIPFIGTMGTVGAICVAIAVIVALTLTPAMLRFVGPRVLTRKARQTMGQQQHTVIDVKPMSTVRAVLTTIVAAALLLVIALPVLSLRLGLPDASSDPLDSTTYKAYTLMHDKFGAGSNGPLVVAASLPPGLDSEQIAAQQLAISKKIDALDNVDAVVPIGVSKDETLAAFEVLPTGGPNDESTAQLVRDLRALKSPGTSSTLGVAGTASGNIDVSDKIAAALPIYLAVVVGLSLIILIGVFRSILVPIIATGGFILSLLATYGVLVVVFQWGWLAPVFGLHSTGPVLNFLPIILVGILFGLAMDYQLFLASGMREAYVHGATAREAVMRGFKAGRTVVIAAAIIMIAIFSGFIFSDSVFIVALGLGLASGILFDAFVVRLLLMPAIMHLLGRSAWWIPKWLDRILPNLDVEGAGLEREHHAV